jgi:virginiamycin B lyase
VGQCHLRRGRAAAAALAIGIYSSASAVPPADGLTAPSPRPIGELTPEATIHVGKTADWVAITADAVWVGSSGPYAVHRIDPATNQRVASVALPGEPCAGLATGFGSLWVPMCTATPSLAKVDLAANRLTAVFDVGPAAPEGGITTGAGHVWLMVDKSGTLAKIDPATGAIRQTVTVPAGSYNAIALDTPGHGGDISFGAGLIWTTMAKMPLSGIDAATRSLRCRWAGPGGDSLGIGHGAIWLTDYHAGTIARIPLQEILAHCGPRESMRDR